MRNTKLSVILLTIAGMSMMKAQVGVNTNVPTTTFEIKAKNSTGATTNVDGLLIPRVDRQRAQSMASVPTSTMIYVNNVSTGIASGTAVNITAVGFYYYNGTQWIAVNQNQDLRMVGASNHITQDAGVGNNGTSTGTGADNIAIGKSVLSTNVDGYENLGMGSNALKVLTNGFRNVAIGQNSLSSLAAYGAENTAIGGYALNIATQGGQNTALGAGALAWLDIGDNNLALGYQSGNKGTGSNNISIGAYSPPPNSNNSMNIGYAIYGTGMIGNRIDLSTPHYPEGNIGIIVTDPNSTLQVGGSLSLPIALSSDTSDGYTAGLHSHTILVNGGASLPSPVGLKGRIYVFYLDNRNFATAGITVSSGAISYLGILSMIWNLSDTPENRGVTVQSDGVNWVVIGRSS